jgi:ABC-type nitrate/sulfonate/bicarbonate transport system permease component
MGASRLQVWRLATFPAALPPLFTGLRLAAVFSVTGAVVAEYVGADRGLGYLSELERAQFRTDVVLAAIVLLAVIGVAFFALVALAERLCLPYRRHATPPRWRHR